MNTPAARAMFAALEQHDGKQRKPSKGEKPRKASKVGTKSKVGKVGKPTGKRPRATRCAHFEKA